MTATPADGAALLRQVFNEVAEDQGAWQRSPMVSWSRLYELVRDTETDGGLAVLQERQQLLDRVQELEEEVARLNGLLSQAPAGAEFKRIELK